MFSTLLTRVIVIRMSEGEFVAASSGSRRNRARIAVAKLFKIPYMPGTGVPLDDELGPREFCRTKTVREPRKREVEFVCSSPRGKMHGRNETSTNPRKYCSYAHAMAHYPRLGSLQEKARNLDSVLALCMDDIDYRTGVKRPDAHQKESNQLFWKDSARILISYAKHLKALALDGYDIGPYLDNLYSFEKSFDEAKQTFFPEAERRTVRPDSRRVSAIPMASFD